MASRTAHARETGSALVSAVGVSAVLAIFAVISVRVLLQTALLHNDVRQDVDDRRALESAIALALREAVEAQPPLHFGDTVRVSTPEGDVAVTWWSPRGRIDINMAPPTLLAAALRAGGATDADALAGAVLDWRDPDDLVSLDGAERRDYERRGRDGPANRFFRDEGELEQVLGFSPALVRCVRPYVTVSTWEEAPEPALASPRLLRELGAAGSQSAPQLDVLLEPGILLGMDMRMDRDRAPLSVSVLLRVTGDPDRPFWLQAWDRYPASSDCASSTP